MRPTKLLLCMILCIGFTPTFALASEESGGSLPAPALESNTTAPAASRAVLTEVTCAEEDGGTAVWLKGENIPACRSFRLTDPFRLVLDFKGAVSGLKKSTVHLNNDVVQQVRVSQFAVNKRLRVVLDLKKNVGDLQVAPRAGGVRVFFPGGPGAKASPETAAKAEDFPLEMVSEQAVAAVAKQGTSAEKQEALPVPDQPSKDAEFTDADFVRIPDPVVRPKEIGDPLPVPVVPDDGADRPETLQVMGARANIDPGAIALVADDTASETKYEGDAISVDIKDADVVDFFRWISDTVGMNIVVDPSVAGKITMKLDNVPWDQVFDLALRNGKLDKVIEGDVVRIGTMDAFKDEERAMEELKRARDTTTDVIRVNYASIKELAEKRVLSSLLSKGGEINIDERTCTIIIRDIPERIADVKKLVKILDVPEKQVEIEARIIAANRSFSRSIGVQFGFVVGNLERVTVGGPNTNGTIGGTRPTSTPSSTYAAGNPSTGRGASSSSGGGGGGVSPGGVGNYNYNFPAIGPTSGIGISIGNILDTFLMDAAISAAESSGQVLVISQPKVQAQNNRQAVIEQGLQIPVQTSENNTTSVRYFSASLRLEVTPRVTDDGTIFMTIKLENNRADFSNTVNGIPSIITSQSSTEVLVADGGTTVMGGVLIDEDIKTTDKVPLLGDIPVLGHLFRRDSKQKDTKEILFFLTPRIIR